MMTMIVFLFVIGVVVGYLHVFMLRAWYLIVEVPCVASL